MPRTLRLAFPGAWHHVMNRGLGRRVLFTVDEDRDDFLGLLAEVRLRWGIEVHAATLMTNHYHLLLRDPDGRLSRGMRHLNGVYTQSYNRRHGRDGPLMRGRFKARLVQSEGYLAELVRYIHGNPVEAGLAERAGDYLWSSHRHYLGGQLPGWLETLPPHGPNWIALSTSGNPSVCALRSRRTDGPKCWGIKPSRRRRDIGLELRFPRTTTRRCAGRWRYEPKRSSSRSRKSWG